MVTAISIAIFLIGSLVGLVVSCVALISGTSRGIVISVRNKGAEEDEQIRCISARIKGGFLHTEFPERKISLQDVEEVLVEGE